MAVGPGSGPGGVLVHWQAIGASRPTREAGPDGRPGLDAALVHRGRRSQRSRYSDSRLRSRSRQCSMAVAQRPPAFDKLMESSAAWVRARVSFSRVSRGVSPQASCRGRRRGGSGPAALGGVPHRSAMPAVLSAALGRSDARAVGPCEWGADLNPRPGV